MRRRRREQGVVYVIALAILAGLVAFVATIAASQRLALRAEANRIDSQRARIAAMAGVQRAIAALADTIQDTTAQTAGPTSGTTAQGQAQMQTDEWYTLGNKGADSFKVGNGSFRMEIVDAGSFANLNVAPEQQLIQMPLTLEQVDAIQDWRETTPTSTRPQGGKDEYYNTLEKPYNAKLRRFDSVDELLAVRYFTSADLYEATDNGTSGVTLPTLPDGREPILADLLTTDSYSQQLQPGGAAMINIGPGGQGGGNGNQLQQNLTAAGITASAQALSAGNFADMTAVIAAANQSDLGAVLDAVTTSAANRVEGKINLNTASEAVLMTLPNMTQDLAQGIVNYQSTGFTKPSDLLQVPGFNDKNTVGRYAGYFTVRSSVFLVRVVGEANGSQVALEAVVDTSTGVPRIVKMHEQPFTDMPTRWGWVADTTNEIVLVESN